MMHRMVYVVFLIVLFGYGVGDASAGRKKNKKRSPEPVKLTAAGQQLEATYAQMLKSLRQELQALLPGIDESKKNAYLKACIKEKSAEADLLSAQQAFGEIKKGHALVAHAKKKWIDGAEKGIAATREKLKKVTTDAEREKLRQKLKRYEKSKTAGEAALKERQSKLDKALANEPQLKKAVKDSQAKLNVAQTVTVNAMKDLELTEFLCRDTLDAKLARFVVLREATPRGLAEYAQDGDTQQKLINRMLSDDALLVQMAVADGASGSKYGKAMEIYTAIQKASSKAKEGVLQRLALAISLQHADPITQRNPTGMTEGPKYVDPVKRYLHYEKAFLNNELDATFKLHSVWDYRFVVDGNEPDETLTWGREMLRNYRPDHITTPDFSWRYVRATVTDVRYGSEDTKYDEPELQFFQNVLKNGGVCGRRAFFGRFMLRAFGVPTTARPQHAHAALAHYTPKGWVVCLGGGWGIGWTTTRYKKDLDFLATTQLRGNSEAFMQVKRAQWIGDVVGEKQIFGLHEGQPDFWYGVSLYTQRDIIEQAKAVALAAVGTDVGEANESTVKEKIQEVVTSDEDRSITVAADGVITIPAAACSKPTNNTGKIKFMPSNLGGMQLHYGRQCKDEDFQYTFVVPKAGAYALTARVVTPSWKQHLFVSVNGAEETVDIALPFTVGLWQKTKPVTITLAEGKNVLKFTRAHEGLKGVTIRDFTLTPK